jgi:hypothetical protein
MLLLAPVAALPIVLSSGAAQAATGPWELQAEGTFVTVSTAVPGALTGHRGNWHTSSVDVDTDDDGVTGGLTDWRCPAGENPTQLVNTCTRLEDYSFSDTPELSVTTSSKLGTARISGPVQLEVASTGEVISSRIDLRLRGTGEYIRTVTIQQESAGAETWDSKLVEKSRDGVTATGRVGWLSTSPSRATTIATPITQYQVYYRGFGDGV